MILQNLKNAVELREKLTILNNSDNWKLVCELLEKNDIEYLKSLLLTKEYQTLEDRNRDKDRLKIYQSLINLPDYYLKILQQEETEIKNPDPYFDKVDEIKKSKNKQ